MYCYVISVDKVSVILTAASVNVESYWPGFFFQYCRWHHSQLWSMDLLWRNTFRSSSFTLSKFKTPNSVLNYFNIRKKLFLFYHSNKNILASIFCMILWVEKYWRKLTKSYKKGMLKYSCCYGNMNTLRTLRNDIDIVSVLLQHLISISINISTALLYYNLNTLIVT